MSRLDRTIDDVDYILDCLRELRNIYRTNECHTCSIKKSCKYAPKPGEQARYNCPLYEEGLHEQSD